MKKILFLSFLCLIAMPLRAQRCAVLDFQIGTGVSEEEIDALTYNFRANFNIEGYRIIPKEPMYGAIEKLGINRTDMTQQQMLKLGRQLEAKYVVVGTMNKFMDEYSVDIRAIDVSTGVTVAIDGAAFDKSNYRATMENLAASLGRKLENPNGGEADAGPTSLHSKKTVPQGYTDLGLHSGTLWRNSNSADYSSFKSVTSTYGKYIPSKEQWVELMAECQWSWTGCGYSVKGPNGNSITLPAPGWKSSDGKVKDDGSTGWYFVNSTDGTNPYIYFCANNIEINEGTLESVSVRLVLIQ